MAQRRWNMLIIASPFYYTSALLSHFIFIQVALLTVLRCPRTKGGFSYPHPAVKRVGLRSSNSVRLHGGHGATSGGVCLNAQAYYIQRFDFQHISADPFCSTSRKRQLLGLAPRCRCPSVAPLAMESPPCAFAHSSTAAHSVKAHTAAYVYVCACLYSVCN